jgi:hypothetical protein
VEVDANVFHWTPGGMKPGRALHGTGYIKEREVERLLEEAHARGKRQAEDQYRLEAGNAYITPGEVR